MEYVLRESVRIANGGALVRLNDDARKCVVYLGYGHPGTDDELDAVGTGFFIHTGDPGGSYLITARHVVEGPGSLGDDPFSIRFNTKSGHGKNFHVDSAMWEFHDDPNVDIAVMPLTPPQWADVVHFPQYAFLSEGKLRTKDIGAGDLAYIVGVFYLLHGRRRNMPFVHTGHVALMADDEPIPVSDWRAHDSEKVPPIDIEGILVQAQTLPASSGAPVFVRRSIKSQATLDDWGSPPATLKTWVYGTVWLLGIWHGAWQGQPGKLLASGKHPIVVPAGTGIVSPTVKLIEILNRESLVKQREELRDQQRRASAATPQRGLPADADNPQHREDFNRLLGAAVQKPKQDD